MLCNLQIENIAIIEKTSVDFVGGLNVLSGETGAGKSILIDAIHAVLGEKTSRELIRTGEAAAAVSALFGSVSEYALEAVRAEGIPAEPDGTLLIQRKMYKDGRNLCRVNGTLATVSMLKKIGQRLVNIHGQRDSQALLNAETHVEFVDSFAEHETLVSAYRSAYARLVELKSRIRRLETEETGKERQMDLLRYQIEEMEQADLRVGERDELNERKKLIRNLGKLTGALQGAYDALKGAVSAADTAYVYIEEAARVSRTIEALNSGLADAVSILRDTQGETEALLSQLDATQDDIDVIEARLDVLYRLSKKYGATEEDMLAYLASCRDELAGIASADELLAELREAYEVCERETAVRAKALSESRRRAADRLSAQIIDELHFLDMPSAVFLVRQSEIAYCENGADSIEFLISANPGEEPKPLVKIASGGELSRIMLAIKNVLAEKDGVGTLVFDEIDTGVSGRAAGKIGLKLAEAASTRQVLCVTHLSQIAARADTHYLIEKSVSDGKTYTSVNRLAYDGRVDELARMNGGVTLTQVHRESARQLLRECGHNATKEKK